MTPGQFDDLAVLLAVCDAQSITGAARRLGLDPSTVSRRVVRLEEALGVTLLVRTARGVTPSDAGAVLARRIQAAVNEVTVGIDEVTRAPERLAGTVRLTAPTEVGTAFVIPWLPPFLEAHPEVEVVLELGAHVLALDRREADLALRTFRPTAGDIVTRRIAPRPVRAYRASTLQPEHARRRWLAWAGEDPAVAALMAGIDGARVVLRSTDLAGLRAACAAGIGSAVLPEPLGEHHALVPVEGLDPLPGGPLWLAAPRTSLELPRVRALWEHLLAAFDTP